MASGKPAVVLRMDLEKTQKQESMLKRPPQNERRWVGWFEQLFAVISRDEKDEKSHVGVFVRFASCQIHLEKNCRPDIFCSREQPAREVSKKKGRGTESSAATPGFFPKLRPRDMRGELTR